MSIITVFRNSKFGKKPDWTTTIITITETITEIIITEIIITTIVTRISEIVTQDKGMQSPVMSHDQYSDCNNYVKFVCNISIFTIKIQRKKFYSQV